MSRYGTALYDFEGDSSQSELTFFAGDEVTITNEASMKEKMNDFLSSFFTFSFPRNICL